jgi:hypothetical protein
LQNPLCFGITLDATKMVKILPLVKKVSALWLSRDDLLNPYRLLFMQQQSSFKIAQGFISRKSFTDSHSPF